MFDLETFRNTKFSINSSWLKKLREVELQKFLKKGLPSRKDAAWKYLDLNQLSKENLQPVCETKMPEHLNLNILKDQPVLTFFNGTFQPQYSYLDTLEKEIILLPLSQAFSDFEHQIRPFFEVDHSNFNPFISLNTAFLSEGVFFFIPPHIASKKIIQLLHINQAKGMWHTRNIFILGKNTQITILEHFKGHETTYLHNTVTHIQQDENSVLNYYKIQQESTLAYHFSNILVHQQTDSALSTFHATTGGHLARDDLNIKLTGRGSRCNLKGYYAIGQRQCIDHHILTEHMAEKTQSSQYFKGILKDHSKAIFNGKVKVYREAHQTIAHQSNQNILLSDTAQVNTQPDLEIYNEDVKCTHGATVGPLEQETIFYLQSRGLNKKQAIHLLIEAFLNELISSISSKDIAQIFHRLKTAIT